MSHAVYLKARRERLVASGLCVSCGKRPRAETTRRCDPCRERFNAREKARTSGQAFSREDKEPTLRDIAAELGVSAPRVQQLLTSALRKVRRECLRRGIDATWIIGKPISMLARIEQGDEVAVGGGRSPRRGGAQ